MSAAKNHTVPVPRARGDRVRVLVVDDSPIVRHLVLEALASDSSIQVVGSEANGAAALASIPTTRPDVVTLGIEMPVMGGLETLQHIRMIHPRLRTIMFSTLTTRGAAATFEALSLGADDYLPKPANTTAGPESLAYVRAELVPKIKQFFTPEAGRTVPGRSTSVPGLESPDRIAIPRILAIGASTGGPQALATVISGLPENFPLPVLIVQHMPPMFTRLLAERLQVTSKLRVEEAGNEVEIVRGRVLIAPGDQHLRVRHLGKSYFTALDQGPPENSCRPSVDVLFRSLEHNYKGGVISLVLTGIGWDGLAGAQAVKAAGGRCLVQDEATSAVWGMPGVIARAGIADQVLPLSEIAAEIVRHARQ